MPVLFEKARSKLFPKVFDKVIGGGDANDGGLISSGGAFLIFWAAWADAAGVNQPLLTGTGPVTTDHASAIYALNSSGVYESFAADDPVWQYDADGDYLVAQDAGTNDQIQSNDQTNVEWTATNVTVAQDETGFAEGKDACTLTATAANGTVIANAITAASGEHAAKWYIKRKTGTGDIDLTLDNGTGWTTVTLTSDFDLFAIDQAALTNPQIGIRIVTDTDAIIVGNAECHLTSTVEKVKSLGPIFTTTGQATTSELRNVYPSANHSNTEGPYYLEFENTGDDVVLLEAGTDEFLKIEDGGGGANEQAAMVSCGDGNWTCDPDVTIADAKATFTDAPNAAHLDGNRIYPTGNYYQVSFEVFEITEGAFRMDMEGGTTTDQATTAGVYRAIVTQTTGIDRRIFIRAIGETSGIVGNIEVREVDGKYLKLTDGTTQIQAACAAGEHKAAIAFDADTNFMNLNLDGTWADLTDSTAYDDTLGTGDFSLGETCRNVRRYNETVYTKQKTKIDGLM